MDHGVLLHVFIFLGAACIAVPLMRRFSLSAVLGYLLAGITIGPYGIGIIENPEEIMHFAEFGVVMMLFLIGLELDPKALWRLRRSIVGLGGLQVVVTSLLIAFAGAALGFGWQTSLAVGMGLSLSSTALVLQMLQEKNLLHTHAGQRAFAVLLFQDIAVIPMLLLLPLLATSGLSDSVRVHQGALDALPAWVEAGIVGLVIAVMVGTGKPASRRLFDFIARTNQRELFTATSLAVVIGITLLMQYLGVSPALGAFVAGLVLANSEYRHTLMADIEPFKGLLLGLFFMAVGMGMNFGLAAEQPQRLAGLIVGIFCIKIAVLAALARVFDVRPNKRLWFSLVLAQGSEFAFVLFALAQGFALLDHTQHALLVLAVAISMALTPALLLVYDRIIAPRYAGKAAIPDYETFEAHNPVIIAGYGRVGQIIGRFLRAQGVGVTILENDIEQITLLRKFGSQGFYGDATRLDHLQAAGAVHAKLLIVVVNAEKCLEIVRLAKAHFPQLTIYARARNRRHAYELDKAGVDFFYRETFDSSLTIAQKAMVFLGGDTEAVERKAHRFKLHDEKTLKESFAFFEREPELASFAQAATGELERILKEDRDEGHHKKRKKA